MQIKGNIFKTSIKNNMFSPNIKWLVGLSLQSSKFILTFIPMFINISHISPKGQELLQPTNLLALTTRSFWPSNFAGISLFRT